MAETPGMTRILVGHFLRRFFDNDTVQVDGDTQTTVVRAVSAVAAPGLLVAFFLQNAYPRRSAWGAIADHYWFALFSFVVMGAAAVFEWEMLFPDRLDFLILSPLPVKPLQMLGAKAAALGAFLGLFLVASYIFGGVMLPAVSRGDFFRQLMAHAAAVLLGGLFASLMVLALGGVLVGVLNAARFRVVSPIVQMLMVMLLVLLILQYAKLGDSMQAWLTEPMGWMRWLPPLWFLGLYEHLLRGDAAPAFAHPLSLYAVRGTLGAAALVLLTYPLAWVRMRRMAIEGAARTTAASSRGFARLLRRLLHRLVRRPGERAIFHFVGQTIARNNKYQVYLAMYCGTGLALALGCAVTFHTAGGMIRPGLSDKGLHAAMPLLLFWVVAGLRIAFSFPLNLPAGWVFRITGVRMDECAAAARKWVMLCAGVVMLCVLAALRVAGWDLRHLLVQVVCGVSLCVLLTDALFFSQRRVPFNQARMPGRVNFPLMMTLWGALPVFVFGVISMEMRLEQHPEEIWLRGIGVAAIHAGLSLLHGRPDEIDEEMEGYEGEFQLLGLS